MKEIYVCLDNVRSLFNIGAIFRTCSFFGVKNVVLLGYSGKTKDKNGATILHKEILKTSLGAEKDLNILFLETQKELLDFCQSRGLKLVSFEQNPKSLEFSKWKPADKSVLVFGNEVEGVREGILSSSNTIVEIKGSESGHNSLNVETACGIALSKLTL